MIPMLKSWQIKAGILVAILAGMLIILRAERDQAQPVGEVGLGNQLSPIADSVDSKGAAEIAMKQRADVLRVKKVLPNTVYKSRSNSTIQLTSGNIESFILRCFQGEPCELSEDPIKLYEDFKTSGNRQANDNLISFLRKQLKDPRFRDQYKDHLLRMIEDFYPPEEKQFQEASYYNYLGDLQKSLDLYLDLEKKWMDDPSLRPAPK